MNAARLERKWSVEDSEQVATEGTPGIEYNRLPESEMAKFRELTAPLYDKYSSVFIPGLIDNIRNS
jgi:hypothetical protein